MIMIKKIIKQILFVISIFMRDKVCIFNKLKTMSVVQNLSFLVFAYIRQINVL